jgi:hypothetical protein
MRRLCRISADLRDLVGSFKTKEGPQGHYWQLDFDVVLKFGGTQLRANLRWKDTVSQYFSAITYANGL